MKERKQFTKEFKEGVVFYERGVSRKNFSPAGDQELILRPPALN